MAPARAARRAPALLLAALLAVTLPGSSFVGQRPPARTARAPLEALPPAVVSLRKPALRRVLDGAVGWVTAPYRYAKMAKITKELVEATKEKFKDEMQEMKKSGDSSGASRTLQDLLPLYVWGHAVARTPVDTFRELLNTTLDTFIGGIVAKEKFKFEPYHEAIRGPDLDYYAWGNDVFRSMIKYRSSKVLGMDKVREIAELLKKGENVVLLANHQTEADPQVLSILMEIEGMEYLAENCIFVAGHKVTTDPLAVPFSMGRNLLTIYSKKYLSTFEAEEREVKNQHNKETVAEIQRLFKEGGKLIWVAPSGGRDRRSAESGIFEPAAFDASSVGLFVLLAQKAAKAVEHKTHFFPLAMWTHNLVPPPESQEAKVGETRNVARAPVALEFGPEVGVEEVGGRKKFPAAAEKAVRDHYMHLHGVMSR